MKVLNVLKKYGSRAALLAGSAVVFVSNARAVDGVVPAAADMTAGITAISGVAGAGAILGLSIFLYRKTKAKAGQALG